MIDDLWYKNAVIYSLNVGTFMDSNGDGSLFSRRPIAMRVMTSQTTMVSIHATVPRATSWISHTRPRNAECGSSLIWS